MGLAMAKTEALSPNESLAVLSGQDDGEDIDIQTPIKVENIHIEGVNKTQPGLVTSQLEGLFDAKTFDELMEGTHGAKLRLQRLGIFSNIEIFIDVSKTENASPEGLDVHFVVEESKRLTGNVGTNVGNNEGSVVLGGKWNNLRGSGESVRVDISMGTKCSSAHEFTFSKPLFQSPDCKLLFKGYQATTDFTQCFFRQKSQGLGTEFSVPSPLGIHTIKYDGQCRENFDVPSSAPFEIREQAGHVAKSSIQHSLVSDGRDNSILPTKGHLFKHLLEFTGLGGDVKFVKSELEIQLNKEIIEDIVLGISFQAGAVKSFGGSDTLINDRFFLGGPMSVRGFTMRGIGPRMKEASLGADAFWAAGLHLYTPLPFRPGRGGFGDLFRMHVFANAGNAQNIELTRYNSNAVNKLLTEARWSYGIGIMMMLGGVARLEVNYCVPKNAKATDGVNPGLQVGVGMNFL